MASRWITCSMLSSTSPWFATERDGPCPRSSGRPQQNARGAPPPPIVGDHDHVQPPPPRRIDSWRTAEVNASAWMRYWGFDDASVTPEGNDGGIDVRSSTAIAQVKREATDIGVEALQRLAGARMNQHDLGLLFFSGSGYTRKAMQYAEAVGMSLFVYEVDGVMVPVSSEAKRLIAERHRRAQQPSGSIGRASSDAVGTGPDSVRASGVEPAAAAPPLAPPRDLIRPVTDFPEVVRLIRRGRKDKAADAYAAAAGVSLREAKKAVQGAWAAAVFMPPGRHGRS